MGGEAEKTRKSTLGRPLINLLSLDSVTHLSELGLERVQQHVVLNFCET